MLTLTYRGEQRNGDFIYLTKLDLDHSAYIKENNTLYTTMLTKPPKGFNIKPIKDLLKDIKGKTINIPFRSHTASFVEKIKKIAKVKNSDSWFIKKRRIKNKEELNLIKKAESKTLKWIEKNIEGIEDKTEITLTRALLREDLSFFPIVAFSTNTVIPHHKPTNKKFKDIALIDIGLKEKEYCSDTTTMLVKNKTLIKELEIAENIFFSLFDKLKDNYPITMKDVEKLYKTELNKKNKKTLHSIGHGLGIDVHESPYSNEKIELRNTVIAFEPAFYHRYGFRLERALAFSNTGKPYFLNKPKKLWIEI